MKSGAGTLRDSLRLSVACPASVCADDDAIRRLGLVMVYRIITDSLREPETMTYMLETAHACEIGSFGFWSRVAGFDGAAIADRFKDDPARVRAGLLGCRLGKRGLRA